MIDLVEWLESGTSGYNSVCELGAGLFHHFNYYKCKLKIGIELCQLYIDNRVYTNSDCIAICGDAKKFETFLKDIEIKTPDVFVLFDFIEHLEKDISIDLIKRIQKNAKKILINTPDGTNSLEGDGWSFWDSNIEKKATEKQKIQAIAAQTHRSVWHEKDLRDLGFNTISEYRLPVSRSNFTEANKKQFGEDGGNTIWAIWTK